MEKNTNWLIRLWQGYLLNTSIVQIESIRVARNNLLFFILLVSSVAGLPVIIIGFSEAMALHQPTTAFLYLIFYCLVLITTIFFTKIPYHISVYTILSSLYLLAVLNLIAYAMNGAAIPLFLILFVLSTIFLGIKSGFITILSATIPMLIIGYLYVNNIFSLGVGLDIISTNTISWITAGAVMIFLGCIITFSFGIVQKRMINSHKISLMQANELKKLNKELETDLQIMKESEEELKGANENFMEVVSSISTAVWKADIAQDGTFHNVYISSVADELLALTPGSINNDWDKFISYAKSEYLSIVHAATIRAIKNPGKIVQFELEMTKANGQSAWHFIKGKCVKKEGYLRVIGTSADITEIKKTNNELRKHREHLEELVKERTSVLEIQKTDLLAMNKVFVGREFRIKELRDKVKVLERKLGE